MLYWEDERCAYMPIFFHGNKGIPCLTTNDKRMPVVRGQFEFCLINVWERKSSAAFALFFIFCCSTFPRGGLCC